MCQVRSFTLSVHVQLDGAASMVAWQLTRQEGLLDVQLLTEGHHGPAGALKRCQAELGVALSDLYDEARCPTL